MSPLSLPTRCRFKFRRSFRVPCSSVTLLRCKIYRLALLGKPYLNIKRVLKLLLYIKKDSSMLIRLKRRMRLNAVIWMLSDMLKYSLVMVSLSKWARKPTEASNTVRWLTKFKARSWSTQSKGTFSSLASSTLTRKADPCSQAATLASVIGKWLALAPLPLSNRRMLHVKARATYATKCLSLGQSLLSLRMHSSSATSPTSARQAASCNSDISVLCVLVLMSFQMTLISISRLRCQLVAPSSAESPSASITKVQRWDSMPH